MIYGIGTDIVLIDRVKNSEAFAKKILSADELEKVVNFTKIYKRSYHQ